ncbi:WD repeat-containing protein 41-like [Glandiceps talaboti]
MSLFKWRGNMKEDDKSRQVARQVGVVNIIDDQPHNPYTEVQVLSGHTDIVHHLFKADEERFVSAADDNTAIIWDLETGQKLASLRGHSRPITCMLVICSDLVHEEHGIEKVLLTGSSDKLICVWDIDSGQCLRTITEHNGTVKCLANWDDRDIFCSGGQDLCVFSHHGQLLTRLERQHEEADIQCLLPIKNNRLVVTSEKSISVYKLIVSDDESVHLEMWKNLQCHREAIRCLLKISEASFASGSIDGSIMVWTSHALNPSREFNFIKLYQGDSHCYPFSVQDMVTVEERYILAAIGSGFCLYDVIKETCLLQKLNAHYSKILHIDVVYGGQFIGTCSEDGTIRLWGSQTMPERNEGDTGDTEPSVLVKLMGKNAPRCKDRRNRRSIATYPVFEPLLLGECLGHSGGVCAFLDYNSNGIASCGTDGLVILWKDGAVQATKRNDIVRQMLKWNVL